MSRISPIPINENITIGLIPARGGSKSIPLKNIAPIAGQPMIAYVIAAGGKSRHLSNVICSTDHGAIASICREHGVEVLERPPYLGEDDTPVTAVINHALDTLAARDGYLPGMVALLQPTSPFLLPGHVDACIEALRASPEADSAQTVTTVFHNAHAFNQRVVKDGLVRFRFPEERRAAYNKQRKPKHYVFGNLVVIRTRAFLARQECFGEVSVPIEIPRVYSLDVDTVEDLDYADYLVSTGRIEPLR